MDLFLQQVLKFIADFGGLSEMAKISGILLILVESMKVSPLSGVWAKLGNYKVLVGPVLSLAAGLVMLKPVTAEGVLAYLLMGAGAAILHDLLNALKGLPGVSLLVQKIVDVILSLVGPKKL